ncbi:MAG TPA: efflux RND transporter permease subunit, partial [Planctomycetia bacterium]|nr:efflux RND transporter permease subunit [Planctomycetia bacterium]
EDRRTLARYRQLPCVAIGVRKAIGGNLVAVCDAVRERLPELEKRLPPGIQLATPVDYSEFVRRDVGEVKLTLVLGIVLTAAVCFLFLGSIGSTVNICLAIPTSLVGTFFAMHFLGFTLNLMTLLALSLSVGVVVDDAILVLENVVRHRDSGLSRRAAALKGATEISFAAVAATISIVAIFLPMAFMTGPVGRFFYQFGVTVSLAVLISLVAALTLTPAFCAYFLAGKDEAGWFQRTVLRPLVERPMERLMHAADRGYARMLRLALKAKFLVALFGVAVAAGAVALLRSGALGVELVPAEDQSRFVLQITCPVGTSIDAVDRSLGLCEDYLASRPDVEGFLTTVASETGQLINQASIFVKLAPADRRTLHQERIVDEVRTRLATMPGFRVVALDLSTQGFTPQQGFPIDFAVQGPDWKRVTELSAEIVRRMRASGAVRDVDTDYRPGMQELRVRPDREKCAAVGVSVGAVADTVAALVGGVRTGKFTDRGKRYDIRVRLLADQRNTPTDLPPLYVRGMAERLVPLADVATLEVVSTLPSINRYNHSRKIEITANTAAHVSQGEAIRRCQEIAREVLPAEEGYFFVELGNAQAMQDSMDKLAFALGLGIVIAYMVLAVQFNSFIHPFTVLLALPFAATGALATLWFFRDSINMMSMIGLVLLMGLVKKNSIVLVDYCKRLRAEGLSREEAVLTACPVRLRPILMTTLATIAGAIPAAIGWGPGAETRAPMARAIIGGIVLSTLVTLILVPVFYVLLDRFAAKTPAGMTNEELGMKQDAAIDG